MPGHQRRPASPTRPANGGRQAPARPGGPGSNAARAEVVQRRKGPLASGLGPAAAPAAMAAALGVAGPAQAMPVATPVQETSVQTAAPAGPAAAGGEEKEDIPAWAQKPHVGRTLKEGATGPDVETLQRALGIPVTGTYDKATVEAVKAYQKANKLGDDGIAGGGTLGKLGLRDELRARNHSEDAFIPTYRATAYSESDMYRTKADPYAVGAITKPDQDDDDGGKTYGTYQFESYVYRDGTKKSDKAVDSSTVMRFIRWKDNPYGTKLAEAAKDGVATEKFDAVWKELTEKENKAFGKAQERFLEVDVADKVTAFFDTAKVPAELRKDPDLYDVAVGTLNQYNNLANGMATDLAAKIAAMKSPTADQVGAALQDIKAGKVESHFKSSPDAWEGIRERIGREKRMFE